MSSEPRICPRCCTYHAATQAMCCYCATPLVVLADRSYGPAYMDDTGKLYYAVRGDDRILLTPYYLEYACYQWTLRTAWQYLQQLERGYTGLVLRLAYPAILTRGRLLPSFQPEIMLTTIPLDPFGYTSISPLAQD